jgi:hypothetical protein
VCFQEAQKRAKTPLAGYHHVVLGELLRSVHCLWMQLKRVENRRG